MVERYSIAQAARHALPSERAGRTFSPSPSPSSSSSTVVSQSSRSSSPRRTESPSRQLQMELDWVMSQVKLQDSEHHKVHVFNRRSHQVTLDARQSDLERKQVAELAYVSGKRDEVRQTAENILQEHIRVEEERRVKEEEQRRRELEQERRLKDEEERRRREREDLERKAESERKAKFEREKAEAESRRIAEEKAKAEAAEAERQAREEEDILRAKAEEDRLATEKAEHKKAAVAIAQQNGTRVSGAGSRSQTTTSNSSHELAEARHNDYLALHRKLKVFRREFWESAKTDKILKATTGEMRRTLKTSVGQLTEHDRANNKKAYDRVKITLLKALRDVPSQAVAINDFLPSHQQVSATDPARVPAILAYLLSMFSKSVISAFANECAANTKMAEPIGTLVAQIFSMDELQFKRTTVQAGSNSAMGPDSISLISIFLAKMHKVLPIVFGISGRESTAAGRLRLGWRTEGNSDNGQQKAFIPEQMHHERMKGLGAGYASIALRNFSKAQRTNPYPPIRFWESLSYIVNTNPVEIQQSHLMILMAMLENNAIERFILFFGAVAITALRAAIIELPQRLPTSVRQSPAAQVLMMLPDTLKAEKNFTLA